MNWIIAFLTDRKTTDGRFSAMQGSGIGPTLWIVMTSNLCCISDTNLLFKYADDTNLLVPEITNVDLADAFSNIRQWPDSNGMVINLHETKEIILHRLHPRRWSLPKSLEGIEQVQSVKFVCEI